MGSSPISRAVVVEVASAYPFVLRLYPRLNTAICQRFFSNRIRNSTRGDLPVPPADRLPTQIIGKLKEAAFKILLSNKRLRIHTARPYKSEKGNSKMRIDRSRGALKFINALRCNTKV